MKRLSSPMTVVYKWVFPVLWFSGLTVFVGYSLYTGIGQETPMMLITPAMMALAGLGIMRFLLWDLADQVDDHGTHLVVRRGNIEDRIPFENIASVSSTILVNPPRVTLRLLRPNRLGARIAFTPSTPFSLNPLAKSALATSLAERAESARTRSPQQRSMT